jgi:hypothetical protein
MMLRAATRGFFRLWRALQGVEFVSTLPSSNRLKIRVSVVRFRPWPPSNSFCVWPMRLRWRNNQNAIARFSSVDAALAERGRRGQPALDQSDPSITLSTYSNAFAHVRLRPGRWLALP